VSSGLEVAGLCREVEVDDTSLDCVADDRVPPIDSIRDSLEHPAELPRRDYPVLDGKCYARANFAVSGIEFET
jgi:hypothetical protein